MAIRRRYMRPVNPRGASTLSQVAQGQLPPSGITEQAQDMVPPVEAMPAQPTIAQQNLPTPTGQAGAGQGTIMPTTPVETTTPGVGELVGQFQTQAEEAKAATEERYQQGLGIHEELAATYGQGGTLQTAMMEQYRRQKERDLATQRQQMISSGLMNTTIAAGMPAAYEEQVGTPYRMQMADLMAQRKAEAMRGQAGFIERREDIPPSPELMASLVQTASARPEEEAPAVTGETTTTEITPETGVGTGTEVPSLSDVAKQFTPTMEKAHYTHITPSKSGGKAMSAGDFGDAVKKAMGDSANIVSSAGKGGKGWASMAGKGRSTYRNIATGQEISMSEYEKRRRKGTLEGDFKKDLATATAKAKAGGKYLASVQHADGGYTIAVLPDKTTADRMREQFSDCTIKAP